jgi:hypothetical protein
MTSAEQIDVWQSSHVGQHRFAPNVIQFPHGIYHGRVTVETIPEFTDAFLANQVNLDTLRGSAYMQPPAQAAEYFLRKEIGDVELSPPLKTAVEESGDKRWDVTLQWYGKSHIVEVEKVATGKTLYASCEGDKTVTEFKWRLINIKS